eukprot:5342586-Amphidinium_carterae.1
MESAKRVCINRWRTGQLAIPEAIKRATQKSKQQWMIQERARAPLSEVLLPRIAFTRNASACHARKSHRHSPHKLTCTAKLTE